MQTFTPHPCAQYLLTGQLCLSYLSPLLILTLLENPMFFSPCYSILEKDWMLEKLHFLVKVHQIARRQEDSPQTWPSQSCDQCLSTVTLLVSAGPSFFLFFFFCKVASCYFIFARAQQNESSAVRVDFSEYCFLFGDVVGNTSQSITVLKTVWVSRLTTN